MARLPAPAGTAGHRQDPRLTIALETGAAKRFADAGNFASYSRCVNGRHLFWQD